MNNENEDVKPQVALQALTLDGRQQNGSLPTFKQGGTVRIQPYSGMQPGHKVTFMMRTIQGEFPEAFGNKTVSSFDPLVFTVSGADLTRLSWTMHNWFMYYTVEESSGTKTKSPDLQVILKAGGPLEADHPDSAG